MSENWAIALISSILSIMTLILGWIATTLTGLRKDLNAKVDKADCEKDMSYHCHRLDSLEKTVNDNSIALAGVTAKLSSRK